jgi:hypothetical protein
MSTTIESKVVEMRFDNRHFESNVKESLSTLEKLKQKLNLSGAAKGLENLNTSASKVDMNGLGNAVSTVATKFSALEVMGVTALANITNSAVNAGKRIVSALTIDPVKDGWNEYEMLLNSVQTTMAGTGKTAKEVEKELKKLDDYADKTVYSTSDMLNNLPKFTNAGVELEKATTAMIGIANATALAGGDANKASIAFYNLGQAIGTGYLTRMDYNSINNAGIATMEWKEQMVQAAVAAGTLTKVGEDSYKAGKKTFTLQQLFIDGLQEQWATTDVMMKVFSDYGNETTEIGKKSYAAAQDIKTFSMMMESLKATAGTGWKDTWQIIFGDLDEAKEFWTGLNNFISGIIQGMANIRNKILDSALGRSFSGLLDNIKKPFKEIENSVKAVKDYAKVVDEIIAGKWGNTEKRWNALTAAGYDWAHAQNLVNEKLGFSLRRATSYNETQAQTAKTQEQVAEATNEYILELMKLSDAQLKAKGYTDEQIEAFHEIKRVSKQTGIPLKEFVENIDKIDGRWILINTFKNAGQGLVAVLTAIKDAWFEIFPVSGTADGLFNIIAGLHKFSTYLRVSDEAAENLKDTFKGVFAILDMVFTIVGGPIKLVFKLFLQLFKALDIGTAGILKFTGGIGRAIVAFHDWFESIFDFTEVFKFLAPYIKKAAKAFGEWVVSLKDSAVVKFIADYLIKAKNATIDWFKSLKDSDVLKRFIDYLKRSKESISEWFKGLKETDNIPKYIFQGLINGLKKGIGDVLGVMFEFGKKILDTIRKVLGIHSPSTEFYEIGRNIVQGLFNGIGDTVKMVYDLFKSIGEKLIEIVTNLDIGSIFTIAIGTGSVFAIVKIAKALEALTSPMEVFADIGVTFNKTLKKFNGVLGAVKFKIYAESLKSMAAAIAILAGSIVVLTLVDQVKMWSAVGAIMVLTGLLGILMAVAGKYGGKEGVQFGKMALTLLALGVSMTLMASALKKIADIDSTKMDATIEAFLVLILGLVAVVATVNRNTAGFAKVGAAFIGIAATLLMMTMVIKLLGNMDARQLSQGMLAVLSFSALIVGIIAATKLVGSGGNVDNIGKTIAKIGTAILMMAIVAKILGGMDDEELRQGGRAIGMFSLVIVGLMAATRLIGSGGNVAKIGGTIAGIAGALLMMALVTRILGTMQPDKLHQGARAIGMFSLIIAGLMAATRLIGSGENVSKVGRTLLMVSVAIGIMGITAALLSLIDVDGLKRGIIAVGFLSAFMAGLMFVTKFVPTGIMGTLITLTVVIGLLALSVGILSAINPKRLAGATAALGILMGMFALIVGVSSMATTAMGPLIVMTVTVGVLAGALYLLAQLPVEKAMSATLSLSTLLLAFSASLIILSVVGAMGPAAFIGIAALATLIVALTALIIGIGYLMEEFPILEDFLNNGISVLKQLAGGIGEIIGAFVSGIMTQIASGLPGIATNLSLFMTNLAPFIAVAKTIDTKVLAGVAIVAGAVALLSAAKLIDGITSFLTFGSSFADLGTQLSQFMINALPFITMSSMIQPKIMDGIKTLAEAILILTGADLVQSLASWLGGGNSLADFGSQLGGLGTSMNQFATNLGEFDESKLTTVNCACKAIKTLAQAASEIPNEGGLWGALCGENSLASFGSQLPGLAKHINSFVTNLGTFDDSKVATVDCAGRAITALAQAASEIPNEGGLWAAICGDNSLATFGSKLPGLAKHLNGFLTNLGSFDETKITTVNCACKAIKALAKVANEIPNEGGLWAAICGDNSLATFGSKLPGLGKNIADFVANLGSFSEAQVTSINSACKAIKAIAKLGEIDINDTGDGLTSFGSNMVKFAKKIKSFVEKIGEVGSESIDSAIKKVKDLLSLAKTIASSNISSLKTFGESLKKIAKDGVKGFVKEFNGTTPKADAKKAGKALVQSVIDGMSDKKKDIKDKAEEVAGSATSKMYTKSLGDKAKQAGKDLVTGFVNGIKANKYLAENAGSSIGKAALNAAKKALDSHSPSREAMKLGNYFGQGLVIGIEDYESTVYHTGYNLADSAKQGLSRAISKVSNLITNGIDDQPTIRPVLDLSDVESGAGYLNSMFNKNPSFGITSNLNAINNGMNTRSQNGTNNDVVSAINKLDKHLDKVGGTTNNYNVNGVTYDDGSNITEAVRTLVRAAQLERRV